MWSAESYPPNWDTQRGNWKKRKTWDQRRKVLPSPWKVKRVHQKRIQKLVDICRRANPSKGVGCNKSLTELNFIKDSAPAFRGSPQPSHYSWIGRRQCYLVMVQQQLFQILRISADTSIASSISANGIFSTSWGQLASSLFPLFSLIISFFLSFLSSSFFFPLFYLSSHGFLLSELPPEFLRSFF